MRFCLASFQRAELRPLEALSGRVKPTQQQPPKIGFQTAIGLGFKPHRPARQACREEQGSSLPLDLPHLVDPAAVHSRIVQIRRCPAIAPGRFLIYLGRTFHPQGLVGAFLVELFPPQIQDGLISRVRLQFQPDVPMQALMPAIVLRMTGPAPFQINAQGHPPGRQPAQTQQRLHLGERDTVVTADGSRQSISLEQPFKALTHGHGAGIRHPPQFQHITAVLIAHGQGFTAPALPVMPPALEVHCPHFIGGLATPLTPQPARCLGRLSPPPFLGESGPFQHPFETALRSRLPVLPQIQLPQLAWSPIPMRQLQPDDLTDHRFDQLIGMARRTPRSFRHPAGAQFQKPALPFIAGLGADPIFST